MKKEILKNISNDELKLHEDVNLSLNNNCNVVQDSNVSYGIEGFRNGKSFPSLWKYI